ncbi:MAG TPA: DUF4097 family beta strand repeat-containing protein [Thermoanaerobaculaceae bacterium]|nr:DUF4097 family beta strand repeat-containing protein [Thermoanaerobaculaceae bacterium]
MIRRALALTSTAILMAGLACAETTRTLQATLSGDPSLPFSVENLAGKMTVLAGDGNAVVAVATVHAESEELAAAMRFEQVTGKDGEPALRVRYPLDRHGTIRYPAGGHSTVDYDGHRVTVSSHSGVMVYADVEVRLPRRAVSASFRNPVGSMTAEGLTGKLLLDTGSGEITARNLNGTITSDSGSGDVRAEQIKGSYTCDTGSGSCQVSGFDGDALKLDSGSGAIRVSRATASTIHADTGSGSIRIEQADTTEFLGDTGSGTIEFEAVGARLAHIKGDTGSGDIRLRLPATSSFELVADQGSGDLTCGFKDAQPIVKKRMVVGYRRGDGKIRIDLDTGSGDVTIDPTP